MSKEYSLPPVGLFKVPGTGIVLSSLTAPLSATPSLSPLSSPHAALFPTGSRAAVTTTAKAVDKNCGASNPPSQVVNFKFFDVDIDFLPSEPPHVAQRHHPLVTGIVLEVVYCSRSGHEQQTLLAALWQGGKDIGLHTASAPAAQCAEFIIGPAKGRTRWLTAPYGPAVTEQGECVGPARADLPTTRGDRARERTPRASPGRVLPTTAVPPWVRDTRARAA